MVMHANPHANPHANNGTRPARKPARRPAREPAREPSRHGELGDGLKRTDRVGVALAIRAHATHAEEVVEVEADGPPLDKHHGARAVADTIANAGGS